MIFLQAPPGVGFGQPPIPSQVGPAPYSFGQQVMMPWASSNITGLVWVAWILSVVTWLLLIMVLVALFRFLWKRGEKVK